jgi:hypothetical protein
MFYFFEAIVKGIVSLISFLVYSLSVVSSRKTTDFCVFVLYPATLPKVPMVFKRFFGGGFWVF